MKHGNNEFLQLINKTVVEAERAKAVIAATGQFPGKLAAADLALSNLASLRNLVLTDKLPRPSKGQVSKRASLNLSRGVDGRRSASGRELCGRRFLPSVHVKPKLHAKRANNPSEQTIQASKQ